MTWITPLPVYSHFTDAGAATTEFVRLLPAGAGHVCQFPVRRSWGARGCLFLAPPPCRSVRPEVPPPHRSVATFGAPPRAGGGWTLGVLIAESENSRDQAPRSGACLRRSRPLAGSPHVRSSFNERTSRSRRSRSSQTGRISSRWCNAWMRKNQFTNVVTRCPSSRMSPSSDTTSPGSDSSSSRTDPRQRSSARISRRSIVGAAGCSRCGLRTNVTVGSCRCTTKCRS